MDELGGIVHNIKYENQNFNVEVNTQNKMLGKLGTDIDKTTEKMVKVDSKLKELIASSSQFCLWVVIFIEIAVLILAILI